MVKDFVAVDFGNTSVKFTIVASGETFAFPSLDDALEHESVKAALEKCETGGNGGVGFTTTRNLSPKEKDEIAKRGWWEFKWGCRLPVVVDYLTPETLGTDRLAAALGAWSEYPDGTTLIADLGTALTLDVMKGNRYLGGNISPGLEMRLDALHHFTSRLPRVRLAENDGFFGKTTDTAISQGAVWGVVNETVGAAEIAEKAYGCSRVILTGGDAPKVGDKIRKLLPVRCKMEIEPALVAKGIMEAYKYNHDKEI